MAVTESDSGTQAATINTEHSLASDSVAGVYMLAVDTVNMANGDVLELRVKTKVLTSGTARLAYLATYAHVQADPIKYSIPVPIQEDGGISATLKQTAGTGRNFDWSLLRM